MDHTGHLVTAPAWGPDKGFYRRALDVFWGQVRTDLPASPLRELQGLSKTVKPEVILDFLKAAVVYRLL